MAVATWCSALAVIAAVVCVLGPVVIHGWSGISPSFWTASPTDAGRGGGIGPIVVSTVLILMVCMTVAVPLGVGTAVFIAESGKANSLPVRALQRGIDVLAGVPSIIFGLFGNALFCRAFGCGFSIISGGLTLACMVLPLIIRTTELGMRAVPRELRISAAGLGLSASATVVHVVLRAAAPSFVAGVVLALGRAVSETAALIFTSGYVDRVPTSLWDSGRSLSVHIYDLSMNVPGGDRNAFRASFLLVVFLLLINGGTRWVTRWLSIEAT
jgi:phosphate transport system permease protein